MKYKNEHQRQMAILEASLPYVTPTSRHGIRLLLQADSLLQLARQEPDEASENYSLEAAEAGEEKEVPLHPDPQGLLTHIQEFLTPRESDMVQTVLNFMNANRLLQNYNTFIRSHTYSGGDLEASEENPESNTSSAPNNNPANPMQMLFQLINGLGALGNGFSNSPQANSNNNQNNLLRDFLISQLNPEQKATFEQLQNIMYNDSI